MDEVSADLINLPPTLAGVFFLSSVPSTFNGLCRVPFFSSSAATSLGAFKTRAGVLIISRIAKASVSAAARRVRKSVSFASAASCKSFATFFAASSFAFAALA